MGRCALIWQTKGLWWQVHDSFGAMQGTENVPQSGRSQGSGGRYIEACGGRHRDLAVVNDPSDTGADNGSA